MWHMQWRIVSGVFAFRKTYPPPLPDSFPLTHSSENSGRYFATGSSMDTLPSSISIAIVAPQKLFVCEHCWNGESSVIGRFVSASA